MRAVLIIALLVWVLYRTLASGNYLRMRFYLGALLLTHLAGEAYLWMHGIAGQYNPGYWMLYSIGTAAVLSTAWLVSTEVVWRNPLRWIVIPISYLAGLGGMLANPAFSDAAPAVLLLLVQAAILTVCGTQILGSLPVVFTQVEYIHGLDLPARVLGQMFIAQAILYHLFAAGTQMLPKAWAAYGEWVPAALLGFFLLRLGWNLKPHLRQVQRELNG